MALLQLYPKATGNRLGFGQRGFRRGRLYFREAAKNFLLLQILFLGLFCWVFGSLFQQAGHTHNLRVAFVDYDHGGAVSQAVRTAYEGLRGTDFPTLVERPPTAFPVPATDLRRAVCHTDYWGAVYVTEGASERLAAALLDNNKENNSQTNTINYNASDVFYYIWNEALYPTAVDAAISSNLQTLATQARLSYTSNASNIPLPLTNAAAAALVAEPWKTTAIDIQPTSQGSRAIYNTLVIILILIQEFFYLGTINGLHVRFQVYNRIHPARVLSVRTATSLTYTLVGALCATGAIWGFRAGWHVVEPWQFGSMWMTLWLFAHLNFLTFDVFSVWLPPPYMPMALITWVMWNVASILLPMQLSPRFYRVGYAFPAHSAYQLLLHIWSGGCNRHGGLVVGLPILFVYEVVSFVLSALGVFRRSHYAALAEEAQAKELKERVDTAVAFERERMGGEEGEGQEEGEEEETKEETKEGNEEEDRMSMTTVGPSMTRSRIHPTHTTDEASLRRDLERVISREDSHIQRSRRASRAAVGFGPSFELPFVSSEVDEAVDGDESQSDEHLERPTSRASRKSRNSRKEGH